MPIAFYRPRKAPPGVFGGEPLPEPKYNFISKALFQWISPILKVGYSRPLQLDDLWDLPDKLQCQNIAKRLQEQFLRRVPPSQRHFEIKIPSSPTMPGVRDKRNPLGMSAIRDSLRHTTFVRDTISDIGGPSSNRIYHGIAEVDSASRSFGADVIEQSKEAEMTNRVTEEHQEDLKPRLHPQAVKLYGKRQAQKIMSGKIAIEDGKVYDMSLLKALYWTVPGRWWLAVFFQACGSTLEVTAPLVTRIIIEQITLAYDYHAAAADGQSTLGLVRADSVGYGVALAFGLFAMQMVANICIYQSQQIGSIMGFMLRTSLTDLIGRKSMRLSGKSRVEMTNGRLTTMMSADASYLDFSCPMMVNLFVQPFQILIGIGLLLYTLGYSALVGLAVLACAGPIQSYMFVRMVKARGAQVKVMDARVRLLSEIINNIRAVKMYAYEEYFGGKIAKLRCAEITELRRNGMSRATMISTMSFIPILAAVLTFITYGLSGHELKAANIFSGLQYFNVLQTPISFLPMALAGASDAMVALGRISSLLRAEELPSKLNIMPTARHAMTIQGDFQFDSVDKINSDSDDRCERPTPTLVEPFSLRGIDLKVAQGALVCVVGRIGTGKSALLNAMLSEMRQLHGAVIFNGPVSYVPQQAWVMAGSILDNITFGAATDDIDLNLVYQIIDACGLRLDLETWSDGIHTVIGEKGINLSGGQRQRICLARAAYNVNAKIVLLDDPLSAVDANVGHHLLHNCILNGPLARRTRILVTHHLDVLPHADLVLVMDCTSPNVGRVVQQGSYHDLRNRPGMFQSLMEEFGAQHISTGQQRQAQSPTPVAQEANSLDTTQSGAKLLLDEERETGSISWKVYKGYVGAMGSSLWLVAIVTFLLLNQVAAIGTSLFLGYWSAGSIAGLSQGVYMSIYAGFGAGTAIFTWLSSYTFFVAGTRASFSMFNGAWNKVMRAPVTWHDRTPAGRIINRLSKDIEVLDDRMAPMWSTFLMNALQVAGTFCLVVYTFPYLGLSFIPLMALYYLCTSFYRQTSREVKRIDSIARSQIYISFGEQLSGLPVIRAFGQQARFEKQLQDAINAECRAYIVTLTIQRWLGVRLDLFSNFLVLLIAIFGCLFRETINPSKLGVVLTYTLSAASVLSNLVYLFAQTEQEMNIVERVMHYNALESEASLVSVSDPGPEWPSSGQIEFQNVQLRYRPDLPLVLKGLSFTIYPGEKVGIVGRTGAGKTSIAQALFRIVELSAGRISVDSVDLAKLGLSTLRNQLSIIPQEAFVFEGTVRDNIDVTHKHSDTDLNAALDLIRQDKSISQALRGKFTLDGQVSSEGSNFSAGEKQLLALIRALVRGSKVLLLDEATSSVDPETEALIQRLIQREFRSVTILCIAHRLQTIAHYDRVLVMDAGCIAEFDKPLGLYDRNGSIFRSLCDRIPLHRGDFLNMIVDVEHLSNAGSERMSLFEHFQLADRWASSPGFMERLSDRPTWSPAR